LKKNAKIWYRIFAGSLVVAIISMALSYKCFPDVCSDALNKAIIGSNVVLTISYLVTAHKVGRRWWVWWFLSFITLGIATLYALILFNNDIKDASKQTTTFAA
jgi:hypothetical protein